MKRTMFLLFSSLMMICSSVCFAQDGEPVLEGFPWPDPANKSIIEVPTVLEKIRIDGSIEDNGWNNAGVITKFYRSTDAGLSTIDAEVSVLFDKKNLIFRFDMPGTEANDSPEKCFLSNEYDLIRSGPNVCICLDPTHDHGVYYQFVIDPAGHKQDLRVADESWFSEWFASVDKSGERFRAEVLIPVSEIFKTPADGEIWGFNIVISGLSNEGLLSSTPIKLNLADAERFGHLMFKGSLPADLLVQTKSSLSEKHREQKEARLAANRAMCGPELINIPGEIKDIAIGSEFKLKGGTRISCLGLDNEKIIRSRYPFFYEKYDNQDLQRLRKLYRLDEVIAPGKNEFEQILLLNEWLVEHITFGSPPPIRPQALHILNHGLTGQTFFCTYLSFTLMQMYSSVGLTARKITTVGHGTLDVWSNYWHKWMQIDPSHNSYFRLRGTAAPLNSNEIRRELWRNGGVDMDMVIGTEQKVEKVTLQRRDKDGHFSYRQDAYAWIAYKTRNNFFEVPFTYWNFLYLMMEDEYNMDEKWTNLSTGKTDKREILSIRTNRTGDIFWTLNQAYIHLYENGKNGLKVQLETVTPNFETYEIVFDKNKWQRSGPVFNWELHPGRNILKARSLNKFGVPGPEYKIVLDVE
ncbi:MAG: hypothetical protein IMY71_15030 [Bacteroidetes bacterium]|nr:hypothetical protein [Bacteroidota bacterium]